MIDRSETFANSPLARKLARLLPAQTLTRALRTALAATITAILTRVLHLEQGYWAVFSAILVMQANFGSSIMAGWARLLGTAAGAFLGALAAASSDALLGQGMSTLASAMFATVFLCALLAAKNENLRLAGLTAAVVICLHEGGSASAFSLGLSRFLEVGLGIVVALGVSLAWPAKARVVLRFGLAKALGRQADLLAALTSSRLADTYDRTRLFHAKDSVLRLDLRNRQLLSAARHEPGTSSQVEGLGILLRALGRLAEHLLAMDHAIEDAAANPPAAAGGGFHARLAEELAELGLAIEALLRDLAGAVEHDTPLPPGCAGRLDRALAAAGARLDALRRERALAGCDVDEVMRFYSFYHSLREAAREARGMADALAVQAPTGQS
jgi:uncharacterized membrane protein YccC